MALSTELSSGAFSNPVALSETWHLGSCQNPARPAALGPSLFQCLWLSLWGCLLLAGSPLIPLSFLNRQENKQLIPGYYILYEENFHMKEQREGSEDLKPRLQKALRFQLQMETATKLIVQVASRP